MMLRRRTHATVRLERPLYLEPVRQVELLPYVPATRTLHLVDPENLMGGPMEGREALEWASAEYRRLADVAPGDHMIVACNPKLWLETASIWRGAATPVGFGPDGADRALAEAVRDDRWVAQRYRRVVIGSGDGGFLFTLRQLQRWGIAVGVVSQRRALSYQLARQANYVRLMPEDPAVEVCA